MVTGAVERPLNQECRSLGEVETSVNLNVNIQGNLKKGIICNLILRNCFIRNISCMNIIFK